MKQGLTVLGGTVVKISVACVIEHEVFGAFELFVACLLDGERLVVSQPKPDTEGISNWGLFWE